MAQHGPIINWMQYLAVRAAAGFMHCFALDQNLDTAAAAGSAFLRLFPERHRRAKANIAASFPHLPADAVEDIAERSAQHMFQLFVVDAVVMTRLVTPASWPRYIHLGNTGATLDRFRPGRPLILVTGHCGNWELLGLFLTTLGYEFTALARPLDNPLLNDWALKMRQARGMRVLTKWGATDVLPVLLSRGGRIGFIADQNAGDQGLFVPYFGRLASTYKSIGLLAMRFDVPIVTGIMRRLPNRFEYVLDVEDAIDPDDWADQPDPLFYVTARYSRAIEMMVRRNPEQYLWMHRRWKSRPKFERQGESFPCRLRRKLEQLPWMTPDELDRIVELSASPPR